MKNAQVSKDREFLTSGPTLQKMQDELGLGWVSKRSTCRLLSPNSLLRVFAGRAVVSLQVRKGS
jgi:hypothetical protein